jgi:hypothetical protein
MQAPAQANVPDLDPVDPELIAPLDPDPYFFQWPGKIRIRTDPKFRVTVPRILIFTDPEHSLKVHS